MAESDHRTPPWPGGDRRRRLANAARRALREAGFTSVAQLKALPRRHLMRVLTPAAYDLVNDALNRGDDAALAKLVGDEAW